MARYKRITKKMKLKGPDEFVGFWERAYIRLDTNKEKLVLPVTGFLVALVLAAGFFYYRAQREASSRRELSLAMADYPHPGKPKAGDPAKLAEALKNFTERFPGSGASRLGALYRADLLYNSGRLDEAAETYRKVMDEGKGDDLVSRVAGINLARTYGDLGKHAEASGVLERLRRSENPFFSEDVDFLTARGYEMRGDKQNARKEYRQFAEKYPSSPWRAEAGEKAERL